MRVSDLLTFWTPRWWPVHQYHALYAGMRDGILVLDYNDKIAYINPAAEEILGKRAAEIIRQPTQQALAGHPGLLEQCCLEESLGEITLQSDKGTCIYELHVAPLPNISGHSPGRLVVLHNITERVRAQRASRLNEQLLKQSEETYRYLVENINEVIFTTDLVGVFTYVSPATEHMTGPQRDQLIGKSYREFIHPEDLSNLEALLPDLERGKIHSLEFRTAGDFGNVHTVHVYIRPILHNGVPSGFLGVATDITERRKVEQALERRASQLAMLNFIGEQIAATIELTKALDSASHLIQKHFGYYHVGIFTPDRGRKELIMRSSSGSFTEFFPEDHHLRFGQGIVGWAAENKSTLLTNDVRLEPRYTNLYPDRIMTRSELAVPILIGDELAGVLDIQSPQVNAFDENDVRVMKTVADQIAIAMENARLYEEVRRQLAERERQENMLRIQRDLLMRLSAAKNLAEMLRVAVETLTEEMNANQVALWLVDWDRSADQQETDTPDNHSRPPAPLDRGITGWVAKNGQPALVMDMQQEEDKQGEMPGTQSLLCVPLISNNKVIGVISLESSISNAFSQEDLRLLTTLSNSLVMLIERARLFEEVEHARKELEYRAAELEDANASLRELDRLKSQFLANMSHELRTPLNSIIGFSEVLADGLVGSMNYEQAEFLNDILNSGRHLLKLINDLLDFSKIEAGGIALVPTSFDVPDLFEELRHAVTPLIGKKGQTLAFEQEGTLPSITADSTRIKQVFLNLLSNANKFTPEGGSIKATCRQIEPDMLLFSVSDNGIGIRLEDQSLIFEEFRQVDGSLTREVPGTGLGLTISKRIVEMHGGKIWVESAIHQGATFYVMLPCSCPPVSSRLS